MNMCFRFSFIVLLMSGVFALTSCGKDYYDVIPKQSPAVACIDIAQIAADNGLNSKDAAQILPFAGSVDFAKPAYAFVSPNNYYGVVFAVDDEGNIESAMRNSSEFSRIEKSGGLHFVLWKGHWQVAWNGDALLVIGPVVATEQSFMRRTISAMFNSREGVSQGELFSKLEGIDGEAKLVARLSALPGFFGKLVSLQISADTDADSVVLKSQISFSEESIRVTNKIETADGSMLPKSAEIKPYAGAMDSELVANSSLGYMLLGLDGQLLVKRIRADKSMRAALAAVNSAIDADRILGSIYGDALIAFNGIDNEGNLSLKLTAETKDASFMNDVPQWKKDNPHANLQKTQDGGWRYYGGGKCMDFNVRKDGKFVCSWNVAQNVWGNGENTPVLPQKAKGKLCSATFNGTQLANIPLLKGFAEGKLSDFLKKYSDITYTATDVANSEIVFSQTR